MKLDKNKAMTIVLHNPELVGYKRKVMRGSIQWTDVYATEEDLIKALKSIIIPSNDYEISGLYAGYEYIHSFVRTLQKRDLSPKQLTQAKRLALQIRTAELISHLYQ